MGIIGGIDEVCFNRDRLFFGGKGQVVLHPDYEARINAESIIEKYWNDDYEQYISNAKPKSKKKTATTKKDKAEKTPAAIKAYSNVDAIREHNVEYLRKELAHEPIEFESRSEFWNYLYSDIEIAELIEVDNPRSFCCVLHEDHNPSANIFVTQNGIQKYRCCSENLTLNIKQLVEMIGNFKSEYKCVEFIKSIYNLSVKESEWSIEQRENIDSIIENITLDKFRELCPQADKNIKYAKDTFLAMLSIAKNNIYSEKFSNDDGEIVFFTSIKRLAENMGKANSNKKMDKVGKYVKMLVYHDLIHILDDEQVPKELLIKPSSFCHGITIEEINEQLLESVATPKIINSKGKEVNHPYVNRTIDSRTFDEICRWLTNLIREKEGDSSILIQPNDIMEFVEDTPEVLEVTKSKKQISD